MLDIGLPKLNGIEVARQIRQLSPSSRIIFLSQNSDLDIARSAFDTGALGYVCKTNIGSELLPAVDAVLQGKQFVSSSLKGHQFTDATEEKAYHSHEVLFYSDDTVLLDRQKGSPQTARTGFVSTPNSRFTMICQYTF